MERTHLAQNFDVCDFVDGKVNWQFMSKKVYQY